MSRVQTSSKSRDGSPASPRASTSQSQSSNRVNSEANGRRRSHHHDSSRWGNAHVRRQFKKLEAKFYKKVRVNLSPPIYRMTNDLSEISENVREMSKNVRLVTQLCQKLINCGRSVTLVTNHRCHKTGIGAKKLPPVSLTFLSSDIFCGKMSGRIQ